MIKNCHKHGQYIVFYDWQPCPKCQQKSALERIKELIDEE